MGFMRANSNYIPPKLMKEMIESVPELKIRKWKDEDVQMMMWICYWCNLRISEALKLSVNDFDIERREVNLGKTKTEGAAKATIPEPFIPELSLYLIGKANYLLPGCNRQIFGLWLKRLGKMLDIPALTTSQNETKEKTVCHIFRKSMAKDMLYGVHGKKASLNVVSKHLRHKGKNALSSTQEYLKV